MIEQLENTYISQTGSYPQDALTGLYNHGFFHAFLKEIFATSNNQATPASLVLIDIDLFSGLNNRLGHTDGDSLLKQAAETITDTIRDNDLAARYSGDVFAVYLAKADADTAFSAADRIRTAINERTDGAITVSIGICGTDVPGCDPSTMLQNTTAALERAKIRGKNRIHTFSTIDGERDIPRARVLIVDDDKTNAKLLNAMIAPLGYETVIAYDGEDALHYVEKIDFDLILLDVMMPGIDGFEVCRRLKGSEATRRIPVILITALDDLDSKVKGIEAGADDFLTKPANREELIARTKSLVKVRQLNKNYTSIENVLFSLANAVEAKDSYTQGHTERVARLAESLGIKMGLQGDDLASLRLGGILHDVGKIGVSGEILNKAGPLEDQEWTEMQSHTVLGYTICLPLTKTLGKALDIVRHHHEKLDGSSYPDGLAGTEVSREARIMGVVDMYDALITDRPYRKAMTIDEAFAILDEDAEGGKIDAEIVENLKALVRKDPQLQRRKDDDISTEINTILVIEDDPLNLKLIRTLLELKNYRIYSDTNAEEVINLGKKYRPDCIIMDIQLPGIDGLEATRLLKKEQELKDIPVIAVSAHAMQKDIEDAKIAGCAEYITKPLDTRRFADIVGDFVRSSKAADQR